MADFPPAETSLAEVGRYARLADARERGLVVSAKDVPHWIERSGPEWRLLVEEPQREAMARELAAFEAEEMLRPKPRAILPSEKVPVFSLYFFAWLLSAFFFGQSIAPAGWEERGVSDGAAILRGEWWRTVTALTLHADIAHVAANIATGALFAAFTLPRLGTGITWLAILLSGALGNAINAWGYRGEAHTSLGASTACFGALGILVGAEVVARWREPHTRSHWQLVVPLGAGLALLAFLGVGDEGKNIDYMAHLWGLAAGMPLGAVAEGSRLKTRLPRMVQWFASVLALACIAAAWAWAIGFKMGG